MNILVFYIFGLRWRFQPWKPSVSYPRRHYRNLEGFVNGVRSTSYIICIRLCSKFMNIYITCDSQVLSFWNFAHIFIIYFLVGTTVATAGSVYNFRSLWSCLWFHSGGVVLYLSLSSSYRYYTSLSVALTGTIPLSLALRGTIPLSVALRGDIPLSVALTGTILLSQ